MRRYGLGPLEAGLGLSLFWAAMLVGRAAQGPLAWRLPLGTLIPVEMGVFALAIVAMAAAPSPGLLYLALVVGGLAAAGAYPNTLLYVGRRYPRQAGTTMALLSMAGGVGSLLLQPVVGRIGQAWGLGVGFASLAVVVVLAAIALLAVWRKRAHE